MSFLDLDLPEDTPDEPRGDGSGGTLGKTEIPMRETFSVYDSSKIQTFQDCPRRYFYNHILGIRPDTPNIHLVFGSGWHDAMEYLLNHDYSADSVQSAYERFMDSYNEAFPNEWLEPNHAAKNPGNALNALAEYTQAWSEDSFETLYTEVAGTAPINDEGDQIHWKVDSLIRDENGYWSMEHKTTGRKSQKWADKWELITQVGTYIHVLHCLFGHNEDPVQGVKINGAILRKKGNEFLRLPQRRRGGMMNMWLWETNHWIKQIKWNMEQLAECSPSDDVMVAFPRNPQSCTKFGCSFPDLCPQQCNPLQMGDRVPNGYKREWWDPRDRGDQVKHRAEEVKPGKENEIVPVSDDTE